MKSLPLATLRAQNQLIEIDAVGLRFDMQETLAFLDRTRPGVLELSEVQLLQRKTEGWPAALRRLGAALRKTIFDIYAAMPSSWNTPRMACRSAW